jgi:hypothetical protein
MTLVFEKKRHFSAENCQKSQKISTRGQRSCSAGRVSKTKNFFF